MTDGLHSEAAARDALSKPADWNSVWEQHFQHYQRDRRNAYYIAAVRRRREKRILEVAAGSFRDMAALNQWGYYCEGVDYSPEAVAKARELQPTIADRIKKMDASHLEYPDRSFDLTFHNGFWGYFDDAQILTLGKEQARVTASRIVATVHNAHNSAFMDKFVVWRREDPLYNVRFFHADEIESLMKPFCRRVTVLPVGGGMVDKLIRRGLGANGVRLLYQFRGRFRTSIQDSERLMCIGEVAA